MGFLPSTVALSARIQSWWLAVGSDDSDCHCGGRDEDEDAEMGLDKNDDSRNSSRKFGKYPPVN